MGIQEDDVVYNKKRKEGNLGSRQDLAFGPLTKLLAFCLSV